jgi:hypothetical protein
MRVHALTHRMPCVSDACSDLQKGAEAATNLQKLNDEVYKTMKSLGFTLFDFQKVLPSNQIVWGYDPKKYPIRGHGQVSSPRALLARALTGCQACGKQPFGSIAVTVSGAGAALCIEMLPSCTMLSHPPPTNCVTVTLCHLVHQQGCMSARALNSFLSPFTCMTCNCRCWASGQIKCCLALAVQCRSSQMR